MPRLKTALLDGPLLHPYVELRADQLDSETAEWVKDLPDARQFNGCWRLYTIGPDPDRIMGERGFMTIGPDERPVALNPCAAPVRVEVDSRTEAVYPRFSGWVPEPGAQREGDRWVLRSDRLRYDNTVEGLRGVPVLDLDVVKPEVATSMAGVGINNVYDLLHTVPRRYIDLTNPQMLRDVQHDQTVAVVVKVIQIKPPQQRGDMGKATFADDNGTRLWVRWFNAGWGIRRLMVGARVMLYGKVEMWEKGSTAGRSMTNPLTELLDASVNKGIIGIYPASGKHELTTWQMYNACTEAATRLGDLEDPVPPQFTTERNMPLRTDAFRQVHTPTTTVEARSGRDRLAYDELLRLQLALLTSRLEQFSESGIPHEFDRTLVDSMIGNLAFPLTGAQRRCIDEILSDLSSSHAMHRLLQGDVGAGKTLVALAGMLAAVESGHQAALVVPTEVLAIQHYEEIKRLVAPLRVVEVALLTNKTLGTARKTLLKKLASGDIHIIIGTQALLQKTVKFSSLGMAVVDEQHRFGVEQRNVLREKGAEGKLPDCLYASATPIPRSAVMTVFGDLDVSVLDEMPPGRIPVITKATSNEDEAWAEIRRQVKEGRQAFVVCPLVSGSQTKEAAAAEETAQSLAKGPLKGLSVGVVTGKQKASERRTVMDMFSAGNVNVLVATTVIEVGVNIPNATVMVILGADRFGVAQLHQLRGRVGRGQWPGTCYLVGEPRSHVGKERLNGLVATTDGFELSEMDLQLRGSGKLTGTTQSGASGLMVADILKDTQLVAWAKEDARKIVEAGVPDGMFAELRHGAELMNS